MRDGVETHQTNDMSSLGLIGLQELQPGRHRVEKVRDFDARTRRHPMVTTVDKLTPINRDFGS